MCPVRSTNNKEISVAGAKLVRETGEERRGEERDLEGVMADHKGTCGPS